MLLLKLVNSHIINYTTVRQYTPFPFSHQSHCTVLSMLHHKNFALSSSFNLSLKGWIFFVAKPHKLVEMMVVTSGCAAQVSLN